MPFATSGVNRIYWKLDGEAANPALLLLNSIGTDMGAWEGCLPHLLPAFQVLRMDMRGHGASDAPGGDYSMAELAADVASVMVAAGIGSAFVAGVSLGGMVAMQLALDQPDKVDALALVCTSTTMDRTAWDQRVASVRAGGIAAIADLAMSRFLSPAFTRTHPAVEQSIRRGLLSQSPDGYAGAAAAIRDMSLHQRLADVAQRTLVVGGDRDISAPFAEHGRTIANSIRHSTSAHVDAGHLAQVEVPASLATLMRRYFLSDNAETQAAQTLFQAGLANRRRVLGDAWVDRALGSQTPFNAEFQEMITRVAWQEVWCRPGLDETTRRLLVVAITGALGRWEEFQLHVRSGLERGGFTADQLKETLMQLAVYAGVPAANTAFAEAGRILADLASASATAGPD